MAPDSGTCSRASAAARLSNRVATDLCHRATRTQRTPAGVGRVVGTAETVPCTDRRNPCLDRVLASDPRELGGPLGLGGSVRAYSRRLVGVMVQARKDPEQRSGGVPSFRRRRPRGALSCGAGAERQQVAHCPGRHLVVTRVRQALEPDECVAWVARPDVVLHVGFSDERIQGFVTARYEKRQAPPCLGDVPCSSSSKARSGCRNGGPLPGSWSSVSTARTCNARPKSPLRLQAWATLPFKILT